MREYYKKIEEAREFLKNEFYEKLCRSGCEIYQKKIGTHHAVGERVRLSGKCGFFALGEVREYEGGTAVKAIKQFDV